jgi:SAM-dependent methyltransferase
MHNEVTDTTISDMGQDMTSTGSNELTLEAYNKHVDEYIAKTYQDIDQYEPEMKEWIDNALASIPAGGRVFEIGSATLRDATYMRAKGYEVTCSDAAPSFVDYLKTQNENAVHFNAIEDTFPSGYNMFFANGVIPHFTEDETEMILNKMYTALQPGATIALSIKYGVGEEWITEKFEDKRFTHFWKLQDIFNIVQQVGFEIIFENDNTGSYPSHRWLNIVAKKL